MKHQLPWVLFVLMAHGLHAELAENDFSSINQVLINIYRPLIGQIEIKEIYQNFGGAFKVDSALRYPSENRFVITLTGQVASSRFMNQEGYAIVACHEIGHILGGEPRQKSMLSSWSSVEGQADYFATNQCMWQFVKNLKNDVTVLEPLCKSHFISQQDILLCSRIMLGIKAMILYFNSSLDSSKHISLLDRDSSKVGQTLQKYPSAQCRVDTWLSGLFNQPRPSCWFMP